MANDKTNKEDISYSLYGTNSFNLVWEAVWHRKEKEIFDDNAETLKPDNCLINTDFYGVRGVVIRKEPDKLILENPGYIRTGKAQMRKGGESDPRNKALMKMFNMINIGERAGSGVPNIFNVWEDEGWVEPVIEEKFNPDRTLILLEFKKKSGDKKAAIKSGDKKVTKKTQMQYDKILEYMEVDKEYSIQDFCELLELKESRTKDILKGLTDYVEAIGSNRNRRYRRKQ